MKLPEDQSLACLVQAEVSDVIVYLAVRIVLLWRIGGPVLREDEKSSQRGFVTALYFAFARFAFATAVPRSEELLPFAKTVVQIGLRPRSSERWIDQRQRRDTHAGRYDKSPLTQPLAMLPFRALRG